MNIVSVSRFVTKIKNKKIRTGDFQFCVVVKEKKDPIGVQLEDVLGKKN